MSTSSDLKHLQVQECELANQLKKLRQEVSTLHSKIDKVAKQKDEISNKILKLTREAAEVIVSEHAILRYLERVEGLDLEEIKAKILPDKTKEHFKTLGPGIYTTDTHKLRIKDNTVVTVFLEGDNEKN